MINSPGSPIPNWWTQTPVFAPFLVGFLGGARSLSLPAEPEALERLSLESISNIFSIPYETLKELLIGFYSLDWNNDPFSRCVNSYQSIGGFDAVQLLSEPTEDTVYFAGEAISPDGFNATVHGALMSGYNAANQILHSRGLYTAESEEEAEEADDEDEEEGEA
jgi:monoamine oxidase